MQSDKLIFFKKICTHFYINLVYLKKVKRIWTFISLNKVKNINKGIAPITSKTAPEIHYNC